MRSRSTIVVRWTLTLGALGLVAGCPRDPAVPEPGEDAVPCASISECNAGASCGELSACVDGFCEAGRSLIVPCGR